jgi:hemoglobin-like flavoprotein
MLDKQTIETVRAGFALVRPVAAQAAAEFYRRLFEADPSLKPMFRGDATEQGEKLMAMIGAAVRLAPKPELLAGVLGPLGARHAGYGVEARHYDTVGAALLETLAALLGDAFTPAQRAAWTNFYGTLARVMLAGAARRAA